jgi:hypothetical protein
VPVGRLTLIGVVLVVAAQVLIPAWGLFRDESRFGWQMYNGGPRPPEFVLVNTDGSREQIDSSDFIANRRAEVKYEEHLPSFLCERFPDARYVLATRDSPALRERLRCGDG